MARESINIRAGFDLAAFSTSAQNLTRSLRKTGKKLERTGKSFTRNLTAPLVGLGALVVREFAMFEQSMAKVAAVSGATGEELGKLTDLSKQLGLTTQFTASEVAGLELNYAKLGFSVDEIEKITEATLLLALATGEDLAKSAEVAGQTLRGFGLDASEMIRVTDVMAAAFSSSALDLEKFNVSMGKIAPIASAAGFTLERTVALMGVLADAGVEASTIGTSMKKIITEISVKGLSYADAMDQIRNSTDRVTTANKLFGARAIAAALILSEQTEKADDLTLSLDDVTGKTRKMADIMEATFTGSMKKLQSAVSGLAISFGEILAPVIADIGEFIKDLALDFSELEDGTKKTILVVIGIAAVIGPLTFAVGSLITAVSALTAKMVLFNLATGGVLIAIGLLVAGGLALTKAMNEADSSFVQTRKSVEELKDANLLLDKSIGSVATAIKNVQDLNEQQIKDTRANITARILEIRGLILQKEAERDLLKQRLAFSQKVSLGGGLFKSEETARIEKQLKSLDRSLNTTADSLVALALKASEFDVSVTEKGKFDAEALRIEGLQKEQDIKDANAAKNLKAIAEQKKIDDAAAAKKLKDIAKINKEIAKLAGRVELAAIFDVEGESKSALQKIQSLREKIKQFKEDLLVDPEGVASLKQLADLDDLLETLETKGVVATKELGKIASQAIKRDLGDAIHSISQIPLITADDDLDKIREDLEQLEKDLEAIQLEIDINPQIKVSPEFRAALKKSFEDVANDKQALEAAERAKEMGESMTAALVSGLTSLSTQVAGLIGTAISEAFQGEDAALNNLGRGLLEALGGFMQQMGAAMIALGIGGLMLKESIKTLNPVGAIIGGALLVAAGAAISSLSKAGLDGTSSTPPPPPGPSTSFGGGGSVSEIVIDGRKLIVITQRELGFRR